MADEIVLPAHFAEELRNTLTTLYFFSHTYDLQESYRKMSADPKKSPMTHRINSNLEMLQSLIELAETDDEPDEPTGSPE